MADQGTEQDKTEAATPYKLEQAREKGSVAKSAEVNSTVGLLAGTFALAAFGHWSFQHLLTIDRSLLVSSASFPADDRQLLGLMSFLGEAALRVLSPLFAIVMIAGVLANLLQTGPVFSAQPLRPDFQRLNPLTGLRRLFSGRSLFEAVKSVLKLSIYAGTTYLYLRSLMSALPSFGGQAPRILAWLYGDAIIHLLWYLVLAAIAIAAIDLLFTRWEFGRKMRMSRRELKDEVRRREGDPQIRAKRRQLQRELGKSSASIAGVKDSDVLVTNPEHYAVALKYRRGKAPAPEIVAKGAGEIAYRMREAAFLHGVPIFPNPRLARALFREVQTGQPVPEQHYVAVADVLRWVYDIRRKRDANRLS